MILCTGGRMLTIGRVTVVLCLVAMWGSATTAARADDRVKSNLDVMREVTADVTGQLVENFPTDLSTRDIRLIALGRDDRYDFVAGMLTELLTAKGYRVYLPVAPAPADSSGNALKPATLTPPAEEPGLMLQFQLVDFNLRYTKVYRSFLVGGKTVKRSAGLNVLAKLVESEGGLVVWMREASKTYDDQFPHRNLREVESGLYQFAKPAPDSRKWGKIVEPVVVSGIIVGLIYLFFSNQGQ
jgi:hypothetical protein